MPKKPYSLNYFPFFIILPAFKAGFFDSLNPCSFVSCLILVLYLSYVGFTQRRIMWLGFLYVLSATATYFGLAVALFDHILLIPLIDLLIHIFYLLLGIVFTGIGILSFNDWWQYKKHSDITQCKYKVPAFLQHAQDERTFEGRNKFLVYLAFFLFAVVVGVLMTIAGAIHPEDEYIYIVHSYLMAGGEPRLAILSFLQYSVASAMPLFIIWIVIFFMGWARKKEHVIVFYKVISAALFLSVGLGTSYFIIRQLFG